MSYCTVSFSGQNSESLKFLRVFCAEKWKFILFPLLNCQTRLSSTAHIWLCINQDIQYYKISYCNLEASNYSFILFPNCLVSLFYFIWSSLYVKFTLSITNLVSEVGSLGWLDLEPAADSGQWLIILEEKPSSLYLMRVLRWEDC